MQIVSRTHRGYKNQRNEDRLLIRQINSNKALLLVADGLGGHPGGDVASSLVAESIGGAADHLDSIDLTRLIRKAGEAIMHHGAAHPEVDGMGSTATLALVEPHRVQWAHVGDSRLYHLQGGRLHCKTRDQTLARQMYEQGEIDLEALRNHPLNHFLTQCLGEEDIVPERGSFIWAPEDILLLNSDGLHNMLEDDQIAEILAQGRNLEHQADQLLAQALAAGGNDNVSLIICMNGA